MAKVTTKAATATKAKAATKAATKAKGTTFEWLDKKGRITPITTRFNEKPNPKAPIKITAKQGITGGMTYAVTLPGAKVELGVIRSMMILGAAGFTRDMLREVCESAGQPQVREECIKRYGGAGRLDSAGGVKGIAKLDSDERKLIANGKKAFAFYLALAKKAK